MNRRTFAQSRAAAALAAAAAPRHAVAQPAVTHRNPTFALSVMLWTVFRDLPFEQRLRKIAEAGYTNVELVGEYKDWTKADFARANAARMDDDPKEDNGRKQLSRKAKASEESREAAFHRYHSFELAVGGLQIAIVLASVSVVTRVAALALGSGVLGAAAKGFSAS